jgi:asparagine synthase (glutamine-hydrolysing)
MCGIAATYAYRGGEVDEAALLRTRDRMALRGPDGEGIWMSRDRRVGLAHRRLSIIDLSDAGAQPMHSADGRFAIVFNGEIYNYRELRTRLEARGAAFHSGSDTEVVLTSFALDGPRAFSSFRGMFALAIWDNESHTLTLARDPYGIKPLYVADDCKTVRTASQVKALLAGGGIDTSPEPAGHAGYFIWGHIPEPFTLYKGVRALQPGCFRQYTSRGGGIDVSFTDVVRTIREAEETPVHQNGSSEAFVREQLLNSVRHHLVADVDVGVFLSSGIDSTTLAALATEVGGSLKSITLGFEEFHGTKNDEVPLAEEIARHYGTDHTTVWIARQEFADELDRLLDAMDQPSTDGVNSYFVSMAARKAGLKVALSGLGGDELFAGYPSFVEIPRFARWTPRMPGLGRIARSLAAPVISRVTSPKYAGVLEFGGSYSGGYLLRRGHHMPWELNSIIDRELADEGIRALEVLPSLDRTAADVRNPHLHVSALESVWYMRNQLLRDTDWASMAHSLEVRVPLVDMQLLGSIAPLIASGAPISKRTLAAAAMPALPRTLVERPKSGFFVPVRQWMLQGRDVSPEHRGLRGWGRYVYDRFTS